MTESIRLRGSSVAELLDCPMRWEKRNIQMMRLPTTPPAMIGTAVHASTAVFDQGRIDGTMVTIDESAAVAVDSLRNPEGEVDWMGVSAQKAEEKALRVHLAYCQDIAPDHEYTLVEHTLAPVKIKMENGIVFELTGTLDRIRQNDMGQRGISDVKTGMAAVSRDMNVVVGKHAAQLGVYEVLAGQEFGAMNLPAGIIGLNTGTPRAAFREVRGATPALVGTTETPGILHYVSQYFKTGLFPPNPGSFMCSARYCPHFDRCLFHG